MSYSTQISRAKVIDFWIETNDRQLIFVQAAKAARQEQGHRSAFVVEAEPERYSESYTQTPTDPAISRVHNELRPSEMMFGPRRRVAETTIREGDAVTIAGELATEGGFRILQVPTKEHELPGTRVRCYPVRPAPADTLRIMLHRQKESQAPVSNLAKQIINENDATAVADVKSMLSIGNALPQLGKCLGTICFAGVLPLFGGLILGTTVHAVFFALAILGPFFAAPYLIVNQEITRKQYCAKSFMRNQALDGSSTLPSDGAYIALKGTVRFNADSALQSLYQQAQCVFYETASQVWHNNSGGGSGGHY